MKKLEIQDFKFLPRALSKNEIEKACDEWNSGKTLDEIFKQLSP